MIIEHLPQKAAIATVSGVTLISSIFGVTKVVGNFTTKAATTSCIITLWGKQYDVAPLRSTHPGGDIFQCGTDMTSTYQAQHGTNTSQMQPYLIAAPTATPIPTAIPTATPRPTSIPSLTPTPTTNPTTTPAPTLIPSVTPTPTISPSITPLPTNIPSPTPSSTPYPSITPNPSITPSISITPTPTSTRCVKKEDSESDQRYSRKMTLIEFIRNLREGFFRTPGFFKHQEYKTKIKECKPKEEYDHDEDIEDDEDEVEEENETRD